MRNIENPSEEVLQQLWRIADISQAATAGYFDSDHDARMHLADAVKMLNRALLFFHGRDLDATLESNTDRHWYMKELRDRERRRVRDVMRELGVPSACEEIEGKK